MEFHPGLWHPRLGVPTIRHFPPPPEHTRRQQPASYVARNSRRQQRAASAVNSPYHHRSGGDARGDSSATSLPTSFGINFGEDITHTANNEKIGNANPGMLIRSESGTFYVKKIHSALAAAKEVAAGRIYSLFARTTEQFLPAHYETFFQPVQQPQQCIASRYVDYLDFGDWLAHADSADDMQRQHPRWPTAQLTVFKRNACEAHAISGKLSALRNAYPDDWWRSAVNAPLPGLVTAYRPLASRFDDLMKNQFALLPQSMQEDIQRHLSVSQLIGDWDPLNAFYRNMGIVREGSQLHVMRLDFASSLDCGFQGALKRDSFDIAVNQRPAVFPELKQRFTRAHAEFSERLPSLGEQFDDLPYADYAHITSGNNDATRSAQSVRIQIALRYLALRQRNPDLIANIFTQAYSEIPASVENTESRLTLTRIMEARLNTLVEQCGGTALPRNRTRAARR
ncbi:hypothetical protein FHW67_003689 [Herbaspirillum sp. Sphag1AN]|uniref:hypothetical protein n=1 Tax=unclassified Herbaspirillum TaxID=2624150 RepID=UPI0016167232|nr:MULTISPECIES: hypothetical protein [unclassified Herbaspirillum]MBB3214374.1 hypothetical protein [Herbaspirillum sp. Sphag1AN]MBB3247426.1 hypothetical protein [Herbaspirillum sp. Sphag64]